MKLLKLMKGQPKYVQHKTEDGCENCWYWFACNRWWWSHFIFHIVDLNWMLVASCVELMYITYLKKCCCFFSILRMFWVTTEVKKIPNANIENVTKFKINLPTNRKKKEGDKRNKRNRKKRRRKMNQQMNVLKFE